MKKLSLKALREQVMGERILLIEEQLKNLTPRQLSTLCLEVCCASCDQLGGYHSKGCKQLSREKWKRVREGKFKILQK